MPAAELQKTTARPCTALMCGLQVLHAASSPHRKNATCSKSQLVCMLLLSRV